MRAIGYLTYDPEASHDLPTSRLNLEREVVHYCKMHGHRLMAMFVYPLSADTENHSPLISMIQYLKEEVDQYLVVVIDPVHMGRTPEDALDAVLMVDSLGSKVICTKDGYPDPIQALLRAISATGPDSERRRRIKEAMQSKAIRGEGLGRPAYGYCIGKDGKFEPVPREADLVRLMFQLYLENGKGLRSIVRYLNEYGYRTRSGGNWSMVTMRDILRNRVYIGTYHRFGLHMPGNHTPIVALDTFRKVQDLMHSRSPHRRAYDVQPFLLSGLAACVECGNRMIGITRRQTWRRKNGQRMQRAYRYYQCQSRTNQSVCNYHTWRASDLERKVEEWLRIEINDNLQWTAYGKRAIDRHIADTDENLQLRHKRRYMKYLKQAADGIITLDRLRYLLGSLTAVQSRANWGLPSENTDSFDIQAILKESVWEHMDYPSRREFLRLWVKQIDVGDLQILVVLN